jgi:hypothetical protein
LIEGSAISAEVAAARGYRSLTTVAECRHLGFAKSQCLVPALLVPIRTVAGEIATYQLRPDTPRLRSGKPIKYETVAGARMVLDVPPASRPHLGNPDIPLWITEGARKVDSAISHGLVAIGLLGVWNWRGTNEHGGKTALPDWESIALNDRDVYLAFDSDAMTNPQVAAALARLSEFLRGRGARIHFVYLPTGNDGAKVGLDDFFAGGGRVDGLLARATDILRDVPQPGLISVPPYPIHVWPDVLAEYLVLGAAARDAPVDMAAVPLAALLGGVIGNRRPLAMKTGWIVRPALWTAVIADPTTGKSPMLGLALDVVHGMQAGAVAAFDHENGAYEAAQRSTKGTEVGLPRPVMEHFFTNNCTMEWIAPAARDSAGIAVVRDELLGWFRDLDAYRNGKGGDRQAWLSLWSGEPLKVDRKSSGTIFAEHPVVSLCGGIQPGRFPELARDAAADAFLARFLLSAPDTHVPDWSTEDVPEHVTEAARALVRRLRSPDVRPPVVLSPEAEEVWRDWHRENKAQTEAAPPLLRYAYGKLPAQVAKMACILHACHDLEGAVTQLPASRIEDAIEVIEYHRAHAIRAYSQLGINVDVEETPDPRERRIVRILRKSESTTDEGWTSRTEIVNGLRTVKSEDLTDILESMRDAGVIEQRRVPGNTKTAEYWRLSRSDTSFGDSDYSEYSGIQVEKSEYSESPNGHVTDADQVGEVGFL